MAGSYTILERIAVGGMGEVFLARQHGLGGFERTVVLKRLLPDTEGDDDCVRRLLDEARIAGALAHDNVVSIIEIGEMDGAPFLSLEYVHGENAGALARRAARGRREISVVAVARIVRDVARGLHHAHTARASDGAALSVVHRDVSPKNIFVRSDGVSKIGDFGIAKSERKLSATATGSVPGTLAYMSPEQARGEVLGPKSDQFSLGIVLWELLCAYRLFKAPSPAQTIERIATRKVRAPSRMNAAAWMLDDVTLRMLERDPKRRFDDMAEVAVAIEEAVPEVLTDEGAGEVALLVEALAGDELRARQRLIERGTPAGADPHATARLPAAPAPVVLPPVLPRGHGAGLLPTAFARVPRTGDAASRTPSRTPSEGRTRTISDAPTALSASTGRSVRVGIAAAVAALILSAAGAAALGLRGADDNQRTRAYLERAASANPLIDAEVLRALALLDGADPDVTARALDATTPLLQQRLGLLAAHHKKDAAARGAAAARLQQQERALEDRARAALAPLGEDRALALLDMWAYDASAPEQWLPPVSNEQLQRDLNAGWLEMMHEQEPMRRKAVDGMLRRIGRDPAVIVREVEGLVQQREDAIAGYAQVDHRELARLRREIDDLERRGTALLADRLGTADGQAVASVLFHHVPRAGEPEPMFGTMPSTRQERERGAVVAER